MNWTLRDWLRFSVVFAGVMLMTLLRGEDPRRDRPWQSPL